MGHSRIFKSTMLLSICGVFLIAQSDNGTIVGFVKDPTSGVVPKEIGRAHV